MISHYWIMNTICVATDNVVSRKPSAAICRRTLSTVFRDVAAKQSSLICSVSHCFCIREDDVISNLRSPSVGKSCHHDCLHSQCKFPVRRTFHVHTTNCCGQRMEFDENWQTYFITIIGGGRHRIYCQRNDTTANNDSIQRSETSSRLRGLFFFFIPMLNGYSFYKATFKCDACDSKPTSTNPALFNFLSQLRCCSAAVPESHSTSGLQSNTKGAVQPLLFESCSARQRQV